MSLPTGELLAYSTADRRTIVALSPTDGKELRTITRVEGSPASWGVSESGEVLALRHQDGFEVSAIATGKLRRRIVTPFVRRPFALSPAGDWLAAVTEDGRVEVWEIPP